MKFKNMKQMDNKKNLRTLLKFYGSYFILMGLLVYVVSTTLLTCNDYSKLTEKTKLKEQEFKKYKDEKGRTIATQEQRILELNKENMKLVETINKFKSISSQVQLQTITEYKEVKVPYNVEVVKYLDTWTNDLYIKLPLTCELKDSFLYLVGSVGADGLEIDTLRIPNEFTITTGKKKGGFFKKDEYIIEVVSNNPHTDISKLRNTQFKPKTPFFKRWYVGFGFGFLFSTFLIK